MPSDFEQLLRDIFGESATRLNDFQREQTRKLQLKLQEFAREALHDDLTKLHTEINELRSRVAVLESERAENAADRV